MSSLELHVHILYMYFLLGCPGISWDTIGCGRYRIVRSGVNAVDWDVVRMS